MESIIPTSMFTKPKRPSVDRYTEFIPPPPKSTQGNSKTKASWVDYHVGMCKLYEASSGRGDQNTMLRV